MHPYRMQRLIKERGKDEVINVRHQASIYQTIRQLLRVGAITIQGKKENEGRPDYTVYAITEEGRKTLYKWLEEMLSIPKNEFSEFPAALSFLMLVTPEDVITYLKKRETALANMLTQMDDQMQTVLKDGLPRLFLLETEYQCAVLKVELKWIQSVIDDIQTKKLHWSEEWIRAIADKFSHE